MAWGPDPFKLSPTSDFLIDVHPRDPRLLIATGGSGHGFKFGSVIGSVVLERLDGTAGGTSDTGTGDTGTGRRWSPIFSWEHVVTAPAPTSRLR